MRVQDRQDARAAQLQRAEALLQEREQAAETREVALQAREASLHRREQVLHTHMEAVRALEGKVRDHMALALALNERVQQR